GSASVFFIPAIGKFVPKTRSHCQVVKKLHGIFRVPRSERASEGELRRIRHDLECRRCPLKETCQAREVGNTEPARRRVFVVLDFLEPRSDIDLMNAFADLHTVRESEKISGIAGAGGIIRTG